MRQFRFKITFELVAFIKNDKFILEVFEEYPNSEQISESLENFLSKEQNEEIHFSNIELGVNKIHKPELNY